MMEKEPVKTIYQDGDLVLGQREETYILSIGNQIFELSDHPYEPCLYLKDAQGIIVTVHNAFTVDELCKAAQNSGSIRMITGNTYDMQGICRLLRKAVTLPQGSADIGYVEGCCFMDDLARLGAVSEETAVDLSSAGMANPNMMNPFLHAKKVCRTSEGKFFLSGKGLSEAKKQGGSL